MSHVISSKTVMKVLIVTNRTPASTKRRRADSLPKATHAITLADFRRLFGKIERLARFGAGH